VATIIQRLTWIFLVMDVLLFEHNYDEWEAQVKILIDNSRRQVAATRWAAVNLDEQEPSGRSGEVERLGFLVIRSIGGSPTRPQGRYGAVERR
jgi:hypothetical protein